MVRWTVGRIWGLLGPRASMKCQVCSTPTILAQHLAFSRVVTLEIVACARFKLVQISGPQIGVGFFTPQY